MTDTMSQETHYEIYLPTIHKCGPRCQYSYMFGFPCGENPKYIDGKCDQEGKIREHSSPQVLDCLDDRIWENFDEKGEFIKHDEIVITDEDIQIEFDYPLDGTFLFDFHSQGGFTRKQLTGLIATTYQTMYEDEEKTANEHEYQYIPRKSFLEKSSTKNGEKLESSSDEDENDSESEDINEKEGGENEGDDEDKNGGYGGSPPCTFVGKVIPFEIRRQMGGLLNRNQTDGKYGIWGHDLTDLWLEGINYNPQTKIVSLSIGS